MRAFKVYSINAASACKFKDTFELVETILAGNGWAYQNLWFNFSSPCGGEIEKALKKVPKAKSFYYAVSGAGSIAEYRISNFDSRWKDGNPSEHLPKAEPDMIKNIVRGVPHSFNIPFCEVMFEGVDWFNTKAREMQNNKGSIQNGCTAVYAPYIDLIREFDYGDKFNLIKICIEVTGSTGFDMLDDSMIMARFNSIFGGYYQSDMICVPEEHEREDYKHREELADRITLDMESRFWDRAKDKPVYSGILPHQLEWDQNSDSKYISGLTPKLSPKRAILKAFRQTDYRYTGCRNLFYTLEKIDRANNQVLLDISMAPNCRRLDASVRYKGPGFECRIFLFCYTPDDQAGVNLFMENVSAAVKYLELNYFPGIQKIYGETPAWIQYTKTIKIEG